jgi:recombination protein RecR
MAVSPLDKLVAHLAKLPGLGPRSARRVALHLLKRRDSLLYPLAEALQETAAAMTDCSVCGNLDTSDPCFICADPRRDKAVICVVEDVADLWAMERSGAYRGQYHVLGGTLSALSGVRPEDLRINPLLRRLSGDSGVTEVILALNATLDGQTTAHYLQERIEATAIPITRLAHGVPVGGELDYLDEGTITAALKSRRGI